VVASLLIALGAIAVAALDSQASDWHPASLVIALAAFGIASEAFPIQLRPRSHPLKGWFLTSSAPFILAAVLLGAAPALAIGWLSLAVSSWIDPPPVRDLAANVANYGAFIVSSALLCEAAMAALHLAPGDPYFPVLVLGIYAFGITVGFLILVADGALAYGESVRAAVGNEWRIQVEVEVTIALATALTAHLYATSGVAALAVLAIIQIVFLHAAREQHRFRERAERISELSASRGRLVGQVLAAEEGERRRLAEALHDEVMQNMLCARQDLAGTPGPEDLDRARMALDATLDQLREAIFELHPTVLQHLGLGAAVEAVADRQAKRAGFAVTVDVSPEWASSRNVLVFTVACELVSNAAEHARASRVSVAIRACEAGVEVAVTDNGEGFDHERLQAAVGQGHVGLASMRERLDALGGFLEIDSQPGAGTAVRACLPERTPTERFADGSGRTTDARRTPRLVAEAGS
jgi:two-component system, NarL family, sensor kinase